MLYSTGRLLKFSWETIWRNLWLSVITVSTITLTLLSISLVVALQVGINQVVQATESRIDLSVYFFPTATEEQVGSVVTAIRTLPGVVSIEQISKEESLARYKQYAQDAPELLRPLEALGENPFGQSLVIKATAPADYERVITELAKPQYEDLVEGELKDYEANRTFIQNFTNFTTKIRLAAIAVSGVFAVIACLLLFNTIRVAIYTHRDEIAVMKLVGATNRFVRAPFVVEAFVYCLISTALAAGLTFLLLSFGQPYLNIYFEGDNVHLQDYFRIYGLYIFGAEFLFIFFLSVMSSTFAIRKYLRV